MTWKPTSPRPSSYLSDVAASIRENKVVIDDSIQTTFNWSNAASSAGIPLTSTNTPGAFRAYYGPASELSYPNRDGTLMFTSDTGVLYGFSGGTYVALSSLNAIHAAHRGNANFGGGIVRNNERKIVALGHYHLGSANPAGVKVNFNTEFKDAPNVQVCMNSSGNPQDSCASFGVAVHDIGTSSFSLVVWHAGRGSAPATARVFWRASGVTDLIRPAI